MKRKGIEGPAFRSDVAAKRALRAAVHRRGAEGYSITTRHSRRSGTSVTVVLKFDYADDVQGSGPKLTIAAHNALCSAGYR